jgi:hypothetical protein
MSTSSSLGYSVINNLDIEPKAKSHEPSASASNLLPMVNQDTVKNTKTEAMLKFLHGSGGAIEGAIESGYAEFKPPNKPISVAQEKKEETKEDEYAKAYYASNNTVPVDDDKYQNKELLDKLNYMIFLLESQKDEKVATVTEDMVLYCFLGVFMIFIVDSFVQVGRYVR